MKIADVVQIIKKAPCAQLGTFGEDGFPEIRALLNLADEKKYPKLAGKAVRLDGETVTLYFTTNTSSRKVAQLRSQPKSCVYFCIPGRFKGACLTGTAEEVLDESVKKEFWHAQWLMYYHKGSSDPDYTLLKFTSERIRCWSSLARHTFGIPGGK